MNTDRVKQAKPKEEILSSEDHDFILAITTDSRLPSVRRTSLEKGICYDEENKHYSDQENRESHEFFKDGFHLCYEKHLSHS